MFGINDFEKEHASVSNEELFRSYYSEWRAKPKNEFSIPKTPQDDETFALRLREAARDNMLERRSNALLDNAEMQALWPILVKYRSTTPSDDQQYITYQNFLKAREEAPERAKPFFTASIYAKLIQHDVLSRVNILTFFNYVMKKVWLQQTRIGISMYDGLGEGHLHEQDLESYISELIPTLTQLKKLQPSFHTFYVCTVVRKFFFFLDPFRVGRVRITDILASGYLDLMLELREKQVNEAQLSSNWFSPQSALRVYGSYLQLDQDRNGMLTKQELSGYSNGTLTDVFIDRVFQEIVTYKGEMDYKSYLDFVLAMENKREPQAVVYFFRVLDINAEGRLDSLVLQYFFQGILKKACASDSRESVSFADIKDEIFDMVKPRTPAFITLDDLLRCGKADTVFNILTDLQGFLSYENREALATDLPEEAEL